MKFLFIVLLLQCMQYTTAWLVGSQWTCVQQKGYMYTPVRRLSNYGDIQCYSHDGKNCLWSSTLSACQNSASGTLNPVTCGNYLKNVVGWATNGYSEPGHWCWVGMFGPGNFFKTSEFTFTISSELRQCTKSSEGFCSRCYYQVGTYAIGYGFDYAQDKTTCCKLTPMSLSTADTRLISEMDQAKFRGCVRDNVKVSITQGMFDALVDMTYNMGCGNFLASKSLSLINQLKYEQVPIAMRAVTGTERARRLTEANIFEANYVKGDGSSCANVCQDAGCGSNCNHIC